MRKHLIIVAGMLVASSAMASYIAGDLQASYNQLADKCKDLNCVNQNLEMIDQQIAQLVSKRMSFIRRSVDLKKHSVLYRNAPTAGTQSSKGAVEFTKSIGGSPGVTSDIFKEINRQAKDYEKKELGGKKPSQ